MSPAVSEHTCPLPDLRTQQEWVDEQEDWRAAYWRCYPGCGTTWHIIEDTCGECGRSDGPYWNRVNGQVFIGPYLPPEPTPLWMDFSFPEVTTRRGGIRFGETVEGPQPLVIIGRPFDQIQRAEAHARAAEKALHLETNYGVHEENGIVAAGGWCAPSETVYDLGGGQ